MDEKIENMNTDKIYQEFETKLISGQLYSCSLSDLYKYVEALSVFEGSEVHNYIVRAAQLQTLNNLISVRTLNKVDSTIKVLNKRNTRLTILVIFLTLLAVVVSTGQLYFAFTKKPTINIQLPLKEEVSIKSIMTKQSNANYEEKELVAPKSK